MDFLLGLLGVAVVVGIPVCLVVLLVGQARLRKRVQMLERRLAAAGPPPTQTAAPEAHEAHEAPRAAPPPPFVPAPEEPRAPEPETPQPAGRQAGPAMFVFRREKAAALGQWLSHNWFLAVAALSLALAGVFLVQYGIETGLLTPGMRVAGAVVLGLALIGAGEWLRRRAIAAGSDDPAYLPSAFGGAGLVSVFAGLLAARQLYGLIGPEAAFIGLALTGAGAVLMGWFYGPFLSAAGILGAVATPFLVGGESQEPFWLYGYFGIVAAVGLAVDAARRWAWLSALVLILAFAAALLLYLGTGGGAWFLAFALALVALSAALPAWSLAPAQDGPGVLSSLWAAGRPGTHAWPEFPTRLVAGTVLAAVAVAGEVMRGNAAEFAVACAGIGLLFAMLAVWLRAAPALEELAAVPAAGFIAMLAWAAIEGVPGYRAFDGWSPPHPEAMPPLTVTWLVLGAAAASALAGWRSLGRARFPAFWTILAAIVAPLAVVALELFWRPALVIGAYPWALHALDVGALMTLFAWLHRRAEPQGGLRVSVLLISALSMIALALILWFTFAALTVTLALTVLAAAALDRRLDLPQLGVYVAVGVGVLVWRLVAVPGIGWAFDAPLQSLLFAHLGVMAALTVARAAALARGRDRQVRLVEAGIWVAGAVLASALLHRLARGMEGASLESYWHVSLQGTVWLVVALAQVRAARGADPRRAAPQWVLAALAGAVWAGAILGAVSVADPAWGMFPDRVRGPILFDTLLLAYALPGAILLSAPALVPVTRRWAAATFRAAGAALLALYAAHEIRRLWHGPDISAPGILDGEQYSYTVAMMALSAGLMLAAWKRRSPLLRRLGVLATGATIAKVFLVDMSGLAGLIRVASFLALGLALAGLAQVNRWMTRALAQDRDEEG